MVIAFSVSFFFVTVWLKPSKLLHIVCVHSCASSRRRVFVDSLLVVIHLADLLSVSDRILTVLWVLVSCLLYSRHVQSTMKEQPTSTSHSSHSKCLSQLRRIEGETCPILQDHLVLGKCSSQAEIPFLHSLFTQQTKTDDPPTQLLINPQFI